VAARECTHIFKGWPLESKHYHAYLLRLWRGEDGSPWRALLENPHTGETLRFSSLTELFAHLIKETGESLPPALPNGT
jgi:hypothetical protein